MISQTKRGEESSESTNFPGSKRPRSTERFKGVVPQQTGHWGAQIYANHQRIWLGTFKSEALAAMAYDSAATKLRSRDSHRNFPPTGLTPLELKFQSGLSTDSSRKAGQRSGKRFIVIDVAEKDEDFGEVVEEEAECCEESLVCSSPSSSGTKVSFRLFGIEISNYV
ncbi:hypothetical protein SASPL_118995 [Salvia splendens]|uniref:AP2/ERF domain-containing protein n=1 Tax=Salvia splendens TaxID=180675 RepID=A0A8X8XYB4_SALSN|nr:hypothetical protein SASPL_118995 [Salvia splendens]